MGELGFYMPTPVFTKKDLDYLQERFSNFYDTVVESWAVDWMEDSESRVKVCIRFNDYNKSLDQESGDVWRQVVLTMEDCCLIRIVDSGGEYYRVTANGIYTIMGQIDQFDMTLFGIDFGHFTETPESILQVMKSPCCVVCSRLSWEIL